MPKSSSSFIASLLICVSVPAVSLSAAHAGDASIAQAEDQTTPGSWPTRIAQSEETNAASDSNADKDKAERPALRNRIVAPRRERSVEQGVQPSDGLSRPQQEKAVPRAAPEYSAAPERENNLGNTSNQERLRPRREQRNIEQKTESSIPSEVKTAPIEHRQRAPEAQPSQERFSRENPQAEPKVEPKAVPETKLAPTVRSDEPSEKLKSNEELQSRERRSSEQKSETLSPLPDAASESAGRSLQTIQPSAPTTPLPVGSSTAPAGEMPSAPKSATSATSSDPRFAPGFRSAGPEANTIDDVQRHRRQRTIGNETLIEEPGNRVIVRENNQTIIRSDETARFAGEGRRISSDRRANGEVVTTITHDGSQVFNIVDVNGRTLRRYRRDRDGSEINIIDNRDFYKGLAAGAVIGAGIGLVTAPVQLPPPRLSIPRDEYVVDYDDASEDVVYETLNAPPVEDLSRSYSLDEVRYSPRLRERTRRLDLNAVNFATGSWSISPSQYDSLERVAQAINKIVAHNPREVFLVEGHTDAVGSDIDNLSLSDRRAESVARILSDEFNVPPENLVTQGYGEQYLKISTQNPERENRRVAIRRITPLISKR